MELKMLITILLTHLINDIVLILFMLAWTIFTDQRMRTRRAIRKRHRHRGKNRRVEKSPTPVEDADDLTEESPEHEVSEKVPVEENPITYPDMDTLLTPPDTTLLDDMEIMDLDETDLFDMEESAEEPADEDPGENTNDQEITDISDVPDEQSDPTETEEPADPSDPEESNEPIEDEYMRLMRTIRENEEEKARVTELDRDRDENRRQNMDEMDRAFAEQITEDKPEQTTTSVNPALLRAKAEAAKEREDAERKRRQQEEKREKKRRMRHGTGKTK